MSEKGEAVIKTAKNSMLKTFSYVMVLGALLLASCGTPKNFAHYIYLQDSVTAAEKTISDSAAVILPGDRLNINITAVNQEAAQAFNISASAGGAGAASGGGGYLVDSSGIIQLLQLGVLHVKGMTADQLADNIQHRLTGYLVGSIVTVSITNFKINMLGEIGRPGVLLVPDGKINILEAISQSGDLTLYGRRDNILVIRSVNGARQFGRLDVSSNKVFLSPYFNLKQNDFVYVEPDKTKFLANDVSSARNIRNLGLIASTLSIIVLIINLAKR